MTSFAAVTPLVGWSAQYFAVIASNEIIINGEVTERSESGLTVMSRTSELTTVIVTPDTAIKKGAVTIKLDEIGVGERVSVTATPAADGKLLAVEVLVRTGRE